MRSSEYKMVTDAVHEHGAKIFSPAWPPWPSIYEFGFEVAAHQRE
jgi:hypothetical protein